MVIIIKPYRGMFVDTIRNTPLPELLTGPIHVDRRLGHVESGPPAEVYTYSPPVDDSGGAYSEMHK